MEEITALIDKKGDELEEQRFQLLQEIATGLSSDEAFPTSFDFLIKLRKALQDPEISIDRIVTLINLEPLIPLHLVRLANSAYYRRGDEVKDAKAAIQRLGLQRVRATAAAIAMQQLIHSRKMVVFADICERLWHHSLDASCAAYVLSRRMTRLNPDEAMLAGLVHDIGVFYLLYHFSLIEELHTRPVSAMYLAERWHASIGHALLSRMGIPEEIAIACLEHDVQRIVPIPPANMSDVVYISNRLAGGLTSWFTEPLENAEENDREVEFYRASLEELHDEIAEYRESMLQAFADV